jgi:hypothetical protein
MKGVHWPVLQPANLRDRPSNLTTERMIAKEGAVKCSGCLLTRVIRIGANLFNHDLALNLQVLGQQEWCERNGADQSRRLGRNAARNMNPEERALAIRPRIRVRADPLHRLRKCGRALSTCDALKAEMLKEVRSAAFVGSFVTRSRTDRNGDRDGSR